MFYKIKTLGLIGLSANEITVEVDINSGLFAFNIVGLAGKSVQESKERVFSAIRNSGFEMPMKRITVNLSPADITKNSSSFDLPIAVAILKATNQINIDIKDTVIWGDLSLEGKALHSRGALAITDAAKKLGYYRIILPQINAKEAGIVSGIEIVGIPKLTDTNNISEFCYSARIVDNHRVNNTKDLDEDYDFAYVKGQQNLKRAFEIASAGGHNILLNGVPGSGKTFISRCMTGILPDMEMNEIIEVTKIYSIAGLLNENSVITKRPFRSPHHTSSHVALIGGGSIPKPGEITLAHRGVLFLDEFNEFEPRALESLRQPLEDKVVHISRASAVMEYPSNFMLIGAMNPCRCGFFGDSNKECICTPYDLEKFKRKMSGPILDRIDLQIFVKKVTKNDLINDSKGEPSKMIRKRVINARKIQLDRISAIKKPDVFNNSDLNHLQIKAFVNLSPKAKTLVSKVIDSLDLSARGYFRILKLSRTIADLEGSDSVKETHIAEAVSYRLLS
ncbi:MAG TPA: YifB family Mg chelatase-like AAA ATPase [Candidatus Dojkabacteria bacterium]|nr:YifB family Mg chelatase-like AAA ATPase [Candidatus Dojkabacteria bacterium]HRP51059.1 YifB family Mg chelatase-like AAA ATPase [Candidatus Dojkabacteria bacterium]